MVAGAVGAGFAGIGLAVGLPYTLSARYGFAALSRCEAARAETASAEWTLARARQREESPLAGTEGHQCRMGEHPGDLSCDAGLSCVHGGCERR